MVNVVRKKKRVSDRKFCAKLRFNDHDRRVLRIKSLQNVNAVSTRVKLNNK